MEEIPYRNTKLLVKTIPKGTLLFRLVKKQNQDELRGVEIDTGVRCIVPNQNVFFYPNPFAAKIGLEMWVKTSSKMNVYILKNDVKVLWLLKPSKYSRVTKNTKRNFIKRCSKVPRGCLPDKPMGMLSAFNPCFSDTMIKKYPDVVGIINLSVGDADRFRKGMKHPKTRRNLKYFHTAEAEMPTIPSIPELILHPLVKRPQKDILVRDGDTLETNYDLLKTMDVRNDEELRTFMDTHAVYDSNTYFFTYRP